ncbi:MAG TPA: right-handed parallel beta-helix repeat-containing protein [Tepidisphaeraceae bacterium]
MQPTDRARLAPTSSKRVSLRKAKQSQCISHAIERLESRQLLTATIVGRYAFYGHSVFDNTQAVSAAIASDKAPLLPGQPASFANYTSYSKGVNGIAIDAVNWPLNPTAADVTLRAGSSADLSTWAPVSQGVTYSIVRGAGSGGSDRVVIRLPDGMVSNKWLQITLNANADTGLSSPDIFYFGNAIGDDGHNLTSAVIDSTNEAGARNDLRTIFAPATISDKYDFNRDGRVDATDQVIARYAVNSPATALQLFTPPAAADPGSNGAFAGIFNVVSFGAVGNGIVDDTASIAAAVNALTIAGRGLIYFPSGTYRISNFINLQNLSNFEIRGAGATLKPTDNREVADIAGDVLRLTNCSSFTISGLTINGNATHRGQGDNPASLRLQGCTYFRVTNCTFSDTVGDGLYICAANAANDATSPHDGLVEGCAVNSAYRNGISFIHGYRVLIQGNLIQNIGGTSPEAGIDIEANQTDTDGANHDVTVAGNRFLNCATAGINIIKTRNPYHIYADSNSFVNCPTAVFNEGINTQVDNNVMHDSVNPVNLPQTATAQIYNATINGQTAEITGNIFYNLTGMSAVVIDQTWAGKATIANNRISGIVGGGYGGIASWVPNTVITGNYIANMPVVSINVMASTGDIESNTLVGGSNDALYMQGSGQTVRNNSISGFPTAIDLRDPISGGPGTATSLIMGNIVTNCPTGVMDVATHSQIIGNVFKSAIKPASGLGSSSVAEVYLFGVAGATAQITGNTIDSLTNLSSIYVHSTWSGSAQITGNQVSNILGSGFNAIDVYAGGSVITGNTLQNVSVVGIALTADNGDIENNTIPAGSFAGIYVQGNGNTVRSNSVTARQYGIFMAASVTPNAAAITTVDVNTVTNCPTGLWDVVPNSRVTGNTFQSATRPASGVGSDAVAQVVLIGATSATAQITGNTFNSLANVGAISVQSNWSGSAVISGNQISNISGSGFNAIDVAANGTTITGNMLQNVTVVGVAIAADNCDIENNTVPGGTFAGFYVQGNGTTVRNNSISARQYGIFMAAPGIVTPAAITTIDHNTVTNCPTGLWDVATNSLVTANTFQSASKPATGPGSDAVAQVMLLGMTGTTAQISGNTFTGLTNVAAITIESTWTGQATIANNQINNLPGSTGGIVVYTNNVAVTGNTLQNVTGVGIAVLANGADIENNTLLNGANVGIYAEGGSHIVKNNALTDYGVTLNGLCIVTANGIGNDIIIGNTITKTVPNSAWIAIQANKLDQPGVNFRYGVSGADGPFTPGVISAGAPATATTALAAATVADSTITAPVTSGAATGRKHRIRLHSKA